MGRPFYLPARASRRSRLSRRSGEPSTGTAQQSRQLVGELYAYLGNGVGGWLGQPFVGYGWQIADAMSFAGDFSGNGHPALLYRMKADGSLWMWTTDGAGGWVATRQIGTGWNICSAIFSPGDFDSDGHPDVMCLRRSDGILGLYRGDGGGDGAPGTRWGTGFTGYERIFGPGDFDTDGRRRVRRLGRTVPHRDRLERAHPGGRRRLSRFRTRTTAPGGPDASD